MNQELGNARAGASCCIQLTKNAEGECDPEMHQMEKGDQWQVGMKAHVAVDAGSDLVDVARKRVTSPF